MFKLVLVAVLLGLVAADNINKNAEIRSFKNDPADAEGNYAFAFDTTNGIQVHESGNHDGVSGSAQYISPEGIPIKLVYKANEHGFQPSGDHLPVPPPIPEAILKSLEYSKTHPSKEEPIKAFPYKG